MRSRRFIAFFFLVAAILQSSAFAEGAVQILIITGDGASSPDAFIAAQRLAGKDSSASKKSGYRHIALDKDSFRDPARLKKTMLEYSIDPRVMGIIVSPAPAGTAAGFQAVKEKRSEIVCAAVDPEESSLYIESYADLVVGTDVVYRAARLARLARQYGISRIIALSGKSPFSSEEDALFNAVLTAACADTGIGLITKPPKESAESFLKKDAESNPGKTLLWSPETLDPLILKTFLGSGNYLIESPYPGLDSDFARLLAQEPGTDSDDYQKTLKRYEKAAIDSGYAGRLGTWIFPQPYVLTSGVAEFLRKNSGKKKSSGDLESLLEEIQRFCPGTKPALVRRTDPDTGVKAKNHFLFKEDTYLLGKGFVPSTQAEGQEKYRMLQVK
jgi:hypothetical protein